jgi:ribosome-associated toxin RatA of RatAB toxin-antitoxin module
VVDVAAPGRSRYRPAVHVLSLVLFVFAQSPTSTVPPPVDVVELVDAEGTPGLRASFDVDAEADLVLDLLWDVARFRTIFPDIKALDVVARPDPQTVDVRFFVDAVVATPTYTLRRSLDRPGRRVTWRSIAGDLKKVAGSWSVVARTAHGSRVVYESFVDTGLVGVSSVYRSLVLGRVEQMAGRVRAAAVASPPRPTLSSSSP